MHSRLQSHMAIMATAAEADAPTSRVSPAGSRPPPPPASHRPVPLPSAATAWHLRPMDRWASPPPPLLAQSDDEMEEPSDDLPHLIADGSPTRERVSPEFTELWRWVRAPLPRMLSLRMLWVLLEATALPTSLQQPHPQPGGLLGRAAAPKLSLHSSPCCRATRLRSTCGAGWGRPHRPRRRPPPSWRLSWRSWRGRWRRWRGDTARSWTPRTHAC